MTGRETPLTSPAKESLLGSRFIFVLLALTLASCNRPGDYAVIGSAEVPSVQGEIEVEKLDKEQLLVTMVVDQLPDPASIDPALAYYVVWFIAVGEAPERKCTLQYDADEMVGRCTTPTSLREFELRITAESRAAPDGPGAILVSTQQIREN